MPALPFHLRETVATPLPRWDGRPLTLPERPPALPPSAHTLALRYWQAALRFRDVALAAFRLALSRVDREAVELLCQPKGDLRLQRELRRVDSALPLFCASQVSKFASGGADELAELIREHHASVVVVDNLGRFMPRVQWNAPRSRTDETEREVLGELRRVISGFDHEIELVLFHSVARGKAEKLLAEGLVDEIEEVRL